jgi:hypothetical protein
MTLLVDAYHRPLYQVIAFSAAVQTRLDIVAVLLQSLPQLSSAKQST